MRCSTDLFILTVATFIAFALNVNTAIGQPPLLEFDVATTVAFRSVTPEDYVSRKPDRQLVEIAIDISARLMAGAEKDIIDVTYEIKGPGGSIVVADYLPRTTLASDVVGHLSIQTEATEGSFAGRYYISQSTGGILTESEEHRTHIALKRLPPKSLLIASGTIDRSSGAYFTLRPTPQTTIQGSRQFVCLLDVPNEFQGDCIHVNCKAKGYDRGFISFFDSETQIGLAEFAVGIYREGNVIAKRDAEQIATIQQKFFNELAKQKVGKSSWWKKLAGVFWNITQPISGMTPPAFAQALAPRILQEVAKSDQSKSADIPKTIADKAANLNAAKAAMRKHNGEPKSTAQ